MIRRYLPRGGLIMIAAALLWGGSAAQDKYKSGETPATQDLRYKNDLEFAKMLEKPWMKVKMLPGLRLDTSPKPIRQPVATVTGAAEKDLQAAIEKSRPAVIPPLLQPPLPPTPEPAVRPAPIPPGPDIETLNFDFYETPITVRYDPALKMPLAREINNRSISEFWMRISRTDYDAFLKQTDDYRSRLHLNDWGYARFLCTTGSAIYDGSDTGGALFAWFMLVKSGYDARIGYGKERVYLLLPTNRYWYEVPYFSLSGQSYYAAFPTSEQMPEMLSIFQGDYTGADRIIHMQMGTLPALKGALSKRTFPVRADGADTSITVITRAALIDYYQQYPLTDLDVYFDAPASDDVNRALMNGLKPLIAGKSEAEAVNFLLHFVQTSFAYETDEKQFGREKTFFADEVIYYPYCDCEDRSVLFAHLVENLIGLQVIGLDYPGHVATAVKFSDDLPGDAAIYNGQKYLICDPTYIGANIGMCMPEFRDTKPTIIPITA